MSDGFVLDAQIKKDSALVTALPLSDVRLMQEKRWFWLLLIPRVRDAEEIFDLSSTQQAQLTRELNYVASKLQKAAGTCDKINIGSLGNVVHQLHLHIIARVVGDAAWPGPVWGHGPQQIPGEHLHEQRLVAIKASLTD